MSQIDRSNFCVNLINMLESDTNIIQKINKKRNIDIIYKHISSLNLYVTLTYSNKFIICEISIFYLFILEFMF